MGDNLKHEGAQQLMQGNIAVKFEGTWPYDSQLMGTTKFVIYLIFQCFKSNSKHTRGS